MLCGKTLKVEHVISPVTPTFIIIWTNGLRDDVCTWRHALSHRSVMVKWRESAGKMFQVEETFQFMESKGEDAKELLDEKWLREFEFWCEIPVHCGRGSFRGRAMWRGNMWELLKPIWPRGRRRCYKETRVTCFQSMMGQICTAALPITLFVEKLSKQNRALRASFLTLEPRKSSLNFSAIHLQLTVKKHL